MILDAAPLEAARLELDVSVHELWMRCLALGGLLSQTGLGDALLGEEQFEAKEFDVVTLALNEEFSDVGLNHPLAYAGD